MVQKRQIELGARLESKPVKSRARSSVARPDSAEISAGICRADVTIPRAPGAAIGPGLLHEASQLAVGRVWGWDSRNQDWGGIYPAMHQRPPDLFKLAAG